MMRTNAPAAVSATRLRRSRAQASPVGLVPCRAGVGRTCSAGPPTVSALATCAGPLPMSTKPCRLTQLRRGEHEPVDGVQHRRGVVHPVRGELRGGLVAELGDVALLGDVLLQ